MKKSLWMSIAITFTALLCLLINIFVTPIPDWLIRTAGIVTLVFLAITTYIYCKNKYRTQKISIFVIAVALFG